MFIPKGAGEATGLGAGRATAIMAKIAKNIKINNFILTHFFLLRALIA